MLTNQLKNDRHTQSASTRHAMGERKVGRTVGAALVSLALVCTALFTGCSSGEGVSDTSQGTAATLDGTPIGEKAVTKYIDDFRASMGLEDKDAWKQWLLANNQTPETMRETAIEALAQQVLFQRYADEHGIAVEQSEVDAALARVRGTYENEADWRAALEAAGLTQETYVEEVLRPGLLEKKVREDAVPESIGTDETVLATMQDAVEAIDGSKRSSHILFSAQDEAKAQEVLADIRAGHISFEEAAVEHSTDSVSAAKGGDLGWDLGAGFVPEYQEALDGLEKGEVSNPVASTYGIHLILCTDVYEAPEGGIESLDQVPSEIVAVFRQSATQVADDQAYYQWFQEYRAGADLQVNAMPSNVSYNVDLDADKAE